MNRDDLPDTVWKIIQQESEGTDEFYDELKRENTELFDVIERIQKKDRERIRKLSGEENN
tara:strand:+ start:764 stop:943 length:180 start_codon:yes stop_codon:yes gene_type:complete